MSVARRFAPIPLRLQNTSHLPILRGVIFDLDGTLIEKQTWMFSRMREALGITKAVDILEHIHSLPKEEGKAAMRKIEAIEEEAMVQMTAQQGLGDCLLFLRTNGVKIGLCTRNFARPVQYFLERIISEKLGIDSDFDPVVDRSFHPPKPHAAPLLHIIGKWAVKPEECIMVGDSRDDCLAGRRANTATVLLGDSPVGRKLVDKRVNTLQEFIEELREGFVGEEVTWKEGEDEN